MKIALVMLVIASFLAGCAHVISEDTLKQVDDKTTFSQLHENPSAHRGKIVLLGGVIVNSTIQGDGTLLEIYQTRTDSTYKPINPDRSEGRFLAHYKGFLESEIYRKGRMLTVAGTAEGEKIMKLGEIDYRYPYLEVRELYLWEEEEPYVYGLEPWGPWWGPWWDPYWGPYWYPRSHFHMGYRHRFR